MTEQDQAGTLPQEAERQIDDIQCAAANDPTSFLRESISSDKT